MRVRTLKAMNNLNLMLMIHMGYLRMLIEDMNKKLLTIKILERSKSLRRKVFVWFSQISKGTSEILKYVRVGIKEYQKIEKREKYKQLQLKLYIFSNLIIRKKEHLRMFYIGMDKYWDFRKILKKFIKL